MWERLKDSWDWNAVLLAFFGYLVGALGVLLFRINTVLGIEILKIVVWPLTIFLVIFLFRPVFYYLFFSLKEFNFFGMKGEIRPIEDVIVREAKKLNEIERRSSEEQNRKSQLTAMRNQLPYLMDALEGTKGTIRDEAERKIWWAQMALWWGSMAIEETVFTSPEEDLLLRDMMMEYNEQVDMAFRDGVDVSAFKKKIIEGE